MTHPRVEGVTFDRKAALENVRRWHPAAWFHAQGTHLAVMMEGDSIGTIERDGVSWRWYVWK